MKTIIQKRADQLQPGDIIVKRDVGRMVVVQTAQSGETVMILAADVATGFSSSPAVWPAHATFDVESHELTSAQQHADELVELLWIAANQLRGGSPNQQKVDYRIRAMLKRINPPQPPTMEEMIRAMEQLAEGAQHVADGTWDASTMQKMRDTAHDIIRRARP